MIVFTRCVRAVAALLLLHSFPVFAELIISEYLEGKGHDKALEIYNTGAEPVTLTEYIIRRCGDGKCSSTSGVFNWSSIDESMRTLEPKKSLVFINTRADAMVKNALKGKSSVLESTLTNFNGNDPVQILKGTTVIDSVGFLGNKYFAQDRLLRRRQPQPAPVYNPVDWESIEITQTPPPADLLKTLGSFTPIAPVPPVDCDSGTVTAIHAIQGKGSKSPEAGNTVTIEGLVTLVVDSGFFVQAPEGAEDKDETTSEGIFVNGALGSLEVNDLVRIRGTVKEAYNETRIQEFENGKVCKEAGKHSLKIKERTLPSGVVLQKWESGVDSMEPYEGMKVKFTGYLTKTYGFNFKSRKNDAVLAREVQHKPTQGHRPGAAADALQKTNENNRIELKTARSQTNGEIEYYPQFEPYRHSLRVGTKVQDISVVVGYGYGDYYFYPAESWSDSQVIPSTDADFQRAQNPVAKSPGHVRIAGLNLLNFFTNNVVDNAPALPPGMATRGAKTRNDFALQRQKTVAAVRKMDADVIGLLELGNNGKELQSALGNLVASLNFEEEDASKHYKYVYPQSGSRVGSDAISVGLIYRPQVLQPSGGLVVLEMPKETGSKTVGQRASMVQKFCKNGNTAECVTVAVSHFKSKRCSGCADDPSDEKEVGLQGCCNRLRTSAAVRLGEYMKANHADDDVLLLGDFNAYGMEDPIYVLKEDEIQASDNVKTSSAADFPPECTSCPAKGSVITRGYGYTSLPRKFHGKDTVTYSYVYDGELGSLDHALGNKSLTAKTKKVIDWHINSLENSLFRYSSRYSGDLPKSPGPYSSSDHDPVLIDIEL